MCDHEVEIEAMVECENDGSDRLATAVGGVLQAPIKKFIRHPAAGSPIALPSAVADRDLIS
jgi:hypothetical protein